MRPLVLLILTSVLAHPQQQETLNRSERKLRSLSPRRFDEDEPCVKSFTLTAPSSALIEKPSGSASRCEWNFQGSCDWLMTCTKFDLGSESCSSSLQITNSTDHHVFCGKSEALQYPFHGERLTVKYLPGNERSGPDAGFQCRMHCSEKIKRHMVVKPSNTYDCDCGDVSVLAKIVNGRSIKQNIYPWMAGIAVKNRKEPVCGGALINSEYVLTAAHCMNDFKPSEVEVRLMHYDQETISWSPSVIVDVEEIIEHPDFTYYMDYDIALLKLKSVVTLQTSEIWNICLPPKHHSGTDWSGLDATVSGWGRVDTYGEQSPELQHSNVTVISREECAKIYASPEAITDSMMCAHGKSTNICEGDSGGPLMSKIDEMDQFTVLGVASWLSQEGCLSKPGVFARIPEAIPWIEQTVGNAKACRITKREHNS